MTRNRARKKSIRARMTVSGEPYSVAARKLADEAEPSDAAAISLLAERVNATLIASSARIQFRVETDLGTREDLRAKFVRFVGDALLKRVVPGMEASVGGVLGEGFIEPPTGRYQIYWGGYATVVIGGRQFFGRPGEPVEEHPAPDGNSEDNSLLEPLKSIHGAASARFSCEDIVRGTPCQVIAVETGSRQFKVWIDDVYIRRVREKNVKSSIWGKLQGEATLELWDLGVAAETLDWSRFPGPLI
jgi:hypothetical protein